MHTLEQFILDYLAEFHEDTLPCLINTAVGRRLVSGGEGAVDAIVQASASLFSQRRITLGQMRYDGKGRGHLTLLPHADVNTLQEWRRNIVWSVDHQQWSWNKGVAGFSPYVILGQASRWRPADDEEASA